MSGEDDVPTLEDLVKSFSSMNHEEQMEKIRDVRRNKYEHRPAMEKRKRKARKKKASSLAKILEALPLEERIALLESLEDESK
jgi:microsomal dipeptidase-like Zn-dependent dipeptidase